jgi:hypothetical protein
MTYAGSCSKPAELQSVQSQFHPDLCDLVRRSEKNLRFEQASAWKQPWLVVRIETSWYPTLFLHISVSELLLPTRNLRFPRTFRLKRGTQGTWRSGSRRCISQKLLVDSHRFERGFLSGDWPLRRRCAARSLHIASVLNRSRTFLGFGTPDLRLMLAPQPQPSPQIMTAYRLSSILG